MLTRRKALGVLLGFIFINVSVQLLNWRLNYWQLGGRASMVLDSFLGDEDHVEAERLVAAESAFRLRLYEEQYNHKRCTEKDYDAKSWAWITAIATDNYVEPAVAMGHTLNLFSCVKKKLVLIDASLSESSQATLKKVGFELIPVDLLDCEMIARKYHVDIDREIPGTHNRFYCWNQTQYSKLIYVDPDVLVLSNIDELFTHNSTFSAALCSPPRSKDNWCFNAGLLVITPSTNLFSEIVESWISAVLNEVQCLDDQNFLFYFFSKQYGWEKLPFLYNVRWVVYYPMKVFHFAGTAKPWKNFRSGANNPAVTLSDMHDLWWYYYTQANAKYSISS